MWGALTLVKGYTKLDKSAIFQTMLSFSMSLSPSELARQLAARRKPKSVVCPVCGTPAVGVGRRTYCSTRCAKRAWWRRHRSPAARIPEDQAALQGWEDDGGTREVPSE
jgi:hypothetical protein